MKNKDENSELSNTVITANGIIKDVSNGAEVLCPTCNGRKTIIDPEYKSTGYSYQGVPRIPCRTCNKTGWVFTTNPFTDNIKTTIPKK